MLETGRLDIKGRMIEEMDIIGFQHGWVYEIGIVAFNEEENEFIFVNDYTTKPLNEIEKPKILMKHTKLDKFLDANFAF